MLRGLSIPRPSRPATNAKKLTFNANLEGHKIQLSQINSSTSKTSFHVKTGQKAAQVTINSTPQAFRFCVQPTKATNLKNETPVVFFVNRRHNSNTQETKETKEETTQDKQKTQDKENPLSTNYHTSLPADKQSLQHVFEPIPKAAKMPSLWLFLIAIILIKEMLSRQSEGIADDLIYMFRRYEDAKEAQDEEQLRSIEASLIQAMNFSSLLFLMGNPKIKSPALLQEVCNFLLSEHPANTSDLALQLLNAAVHCSKHILGQVDLPLGDIAAKFLSKDTLKDTTIVNSLSQVLDTLIIDGYDVTKIASAPGIVPLVDLMAHHPDATIATRASHIFRSIAQNPSSAPAIKDNVATLIHVIKRQDNNESVVYAKEAVQGLIAAGNANPEIKADVEKQLYNGTVSQELVNEITRFERPVSFSKLPKIGTELGLAVVVAVVWGYLRWSRALKKKGVSGEDLQKIVRYRTALTAGVTSVAVGTSILEDNVLAHQSELAADVVAFIGWPLFLAVTPFIIVPSFLSAIVSSHAFDKICDEHRRHFNPTRKPFIHNGRTIYEWDQTLDEVNIYIQLPEGVKAKQLDCKITTSDFSVGIKGNPPYIKESFFFPVKNKDSFWTVEDGELHITLSKLSKGETWLGALKGHQQLNPVEEESAKKQLMLERFQEENPGFDFSGAEFSGQAPDPKTFMDGIA